jgi:hypothetical protein
MVEAKTAEIVMGNHEFNAIGYATRRQHPVASDPQQEYLRPHTRKNFGQHQQFLTEYAFDSPEHRDVIEWFKTFPLWLELDGLRVVHACWSNEHIKQLRDVHGNARVPEGPALERLYEGGDLFDAPEVILKGPEVRLPEKFHYKDKDGHPREEARYRWWASGADTLDNRAVFVPGSRRINDTELRGFDDTLIGEPPVQPYTDDKPVIVGHYWQQGSPALLSDRVVCVDYSAVKGGDLVAYRFDGEATLDSSKLVAFPGD